ncbi:MAG: PAS domain S-box protein [Waterburya sp.]
MSIDRYIEFNPVTIAPDTVLKRAVALIAQQQAENKPSCLLIVKDQELVGILTQSDIVRLVAAETDLATTTVEMVMNQPVLTMLRSQCDNLSAAWSFFQQHTHNYIPILQDNQKLVGLIDIRSLRASSSLVTPDNPDNLNPNQIYDDAQDTPKELKYDPFNGSRLQFAQQKELVRFFEISSIQCIADFDGYFVRTNATLSKVLGFTPEELTNEPFINFVHPEDRVATIAELANLIAGETTISFENRYQTKDGDYRWLLWTAKPYVTEKLIYSAARDITERKNYELGIIQNISDRQQAEIQLQRERDFSEAVINTVGALITVLDRQGAIVGFNRTCEQVTGYCFAEVKGRQIWDFLILTQEKPAVQAVFKRLLKGQFHNQYENYWIAKDGSQHLISWSNTALLDSQGQIEFIIATGIDVTEQRRVWNKLELQYRQTKLLTETTRRIRMSIDLKEILQTTVTEIQHLLVCDRVLIMELKANQNALPISEAILPGLPPMLGYEFADPLLMGEYLTKYHQGQVLAINDLETASIDPDIKQLLKQFEIQAKLVVPILSQGELKGLLIAHQCHNPRQWQEHEIQLLHQLSDQIGVALSQAQLLNYAEELAEERTKELTATNELLKLEIAERTQTEQELRENQQKLAGILDNADEAIISINERQQIQLFNQGAENIFGYQASEIIGQSLDQLLPPTFRQVHHHHIQQFAQSPKTSRQMAERNRKVYGRHKDGHEFPAEASVAKLQTKAGMLFTVMLKDISERQQTQENLQTSKTLLAKAEKIAKIGSWEYDHESNQKSWSEELFNILEFDPSTNPRPTCAEILDRIHPDDLLLVKKTLRAGHQQGHAWELNYRLLLPDGRIKYIESRGEPTINSEGKVLRVLETIMDVSERIQAEKSLQRSEEQLRLITDALPVLIAYIDDQQCYRYNNQTYESWYGKPRSNLQGKSIRELVGEHNYQQMLPYIETALAGKAVTFESQPVAENGNSYWMNATYIPDLNSHGEVKGFFSMIEDITERKTIEQMKSEFISVASHEMRTPLTAIHGVLRLLAAGRLGQLSEPGAKMAEIALRNGDRLVHLVNDILDLERIESGRDEINRQPCDSAELIQLAIDTIAPMAAEQQIILKTKSPSIKLLADRDRIVQTLSNLISNGIKFSPTNSTILISSQLVQQNVLFAVQDKGRGIPQDKLESIFERFQQVDASDSRQKGGTGLGLAICRHIVEQHQGQIWADSICGEGSTFFFTLPQA